MADEVDPFTAFVVGVGHEADGLMSNALQGRNVLDEVMMDLHNNAVGRKAGSEGTSVDGDDLQKKPGFPSTNKYSCNFY